MRGGDLRKIRERFDWSQSTTAEHLNAALDRKYSSATVSAWETEKKPIPDHVGAFIEALAIDSALPPLEPLASPPDGEDTAPGPLSPPGQVPLSPHSGMYVRVCTELWGTIALVPASLGAVFGSEKLSRDGLIIDADKEALGAAWGKLAETNETFRRMLVNATSSGAWLEVGLVTGATFGKMYENHARYVEPASHLHTAPEPQTDGAVA